MKRILVRSTVSGHVLELEVRAEGESHYIARNTLHPRGTFTTYYKSIYRRMGLLPALWFRLTRELR